jgi:hypothetical protein
VAESLRWVFDPRLGSTGRYRDLATGQTIAGETILKLVDDIVDRTIDNPVTVLNTMLADKRLSVADWEASFARQIKNAYSQQAMLAAGGRDQMTQQYWGSLGTPLKEQYDYLAEFAKEIVDKRLSAAQIEARTKMYISSSREAYWRIRDIQAKAGGMTQEQWVTVGDGTVCDSCVEAGQMGWMHLGYFGQPGSGTVIKKPETTCRGLTLCRCQKLYR